MAWREGLRQKGRLFVIALCLAVGFAAFFATYGFSARVLSGIRAESRSLLGADFALSGSGEFPDDILRRAAVLPGIQAHSLVYDLVSMAHTGEGEGSQSRLVEVRAVDGAYPLVGRLEVLDERHALLLLPLPLGDVLGDADHRGDLARDVQDGFHGGDVEGVPGSRGHPHVEDDGLLGGEGLTHDAHALFRFLGREEVPDPAPDNLLRAATEGAREGLVHIAVGAVFQDVENGIRGLAQNQLQHLQSALQLRDPLSGEGRFRRSWRKRRVHGGRTGWKSVGSPKLYQFFQAPGRLGHWKMWQPWAGSPRCPHGRQP